MNELQEYIRLERVWIVQMLKLHSDQATWVIGRINFWKRWRVGWALGYASIWLTVASIAFYELHYVWGIVYSAVALIAAYAGWAGNTAHIIDLRSDKIRWASEKMRFELMLQQHDSKYGQSTLDNN